MKLIICGGYELPQEGLFSSSVKKTLDTAKTNLCLKSLLFQDF